MTSPSDRREAVVGLGSQRIGRRAVAVDCGGSRLPVRRRGCLVRGQIILMSGKLEQPDAQPIGYLLVDGCESVHRHLPFLVQNSNCFQ